MGKKPGIFAAKWERFENLCSNQLSESVKTPLYIAASQSLNPHELHIALSTYTAFRGAVHISVVNSQRLRR
jgi:hypothetical protein